MPYTITKQTTVKKPSPYSGILKFLIVLIAVPVIAIAFLSFVLYIVFNRIKSWIKKENIHPPDDSFHVELELLNNGYIKITATEDETDTELAELNERWIEKVYDEQTYLYRASTTPVVPGIHGKIVCFYLKEQPGGALLQLLTDHRDNPVSATRLVYLQYSDLQVIPIDHIGSFYLYNDEKNDSIIKGFNNEEELVINVVVV